MEHGKNYREKVEKEINYQVLKPENIICGYVIDDKIETKKFPVMNLPEFSEEELKKVENVIDMEIEKVAKELKIKPENNKYLAHYSADDVVSAEINDNLIVAMNSFKIPTELSDELKKVIDKMNEVPNNYPHEDDNFYIPEKYRNMTIEELKAEEKKLLKELKKGENK